MSETTPHDDGPATDGADLNPETGVGMGAGEASTFEPEEDDEVDGEDLDA